MKKLILICGMFIFGTNLFSQEVYVGWDANTEDDLAGYKLYMAQDSTFKNDVLIINISKDSVQFELKQIEYGIKYYLAMTAYDTANNESDFSNILQFTVNPPDNIAPSIPSGVTVKVIFEGDKIILIRKDQ